MQLTVYNYLTWSDIRLGTNDYDKSWLLGIYYSFSAMNTGNILAHQCIIDKHPHLVETYDKFDDCDAFEPIKIACSMDNYAI